MLPLECPFCDRANPADANYCNKCGQRLKLKACPQCAVVNNDAAESCYHCGSDFSTNATPDAARAACDELRKVLASDPIGGSPPPEVSASPGDTGGTVSPADSPFWLRPTVRTPDSEPAIARAEFAAERPRVLPLPDDALLRPDFDLLRAIRPELSHDTTPGQAGERPPLESGPELATLAIDNGTQAPDAGRESRQAVEKPAPEPPTDRPLRGRALVAVAFAAICAMGYYLYGTFLEDPPQPSADVANSQTPRHLPIREAATMATTSPAPIDRPDAAQAEALRVTVPAAVDRRDPIERPVESRTAAVRPEGHQPAAAPTAALPAAPPKRSVAASAPGGEVHRKRPDAAASPVKRVTECTEAIATLGLCTANPNLEAR